jgi:hypothetical protein
MMDKQEVPGTIYNEPYFPADGLNLYEVAIARNVNGYTIKVILFCT